MPKLSLCIPVEPGHALPLPLIDSLLNNEAADLEIILSSFGNRLAESDEIRSLAERDGRIKLLPPAPDHLSTAQLWIGTVAAARGDWVSLVSAEDMIEPDLPALLAHVESTIPTADALGWSPFQIAPDAPRNIKTTVAVPVLHNVTPFEKEAMLEAFFHWKGAQQVPKMPFGLFHGAIKRSLLETILSNCGDISWLTLTPHYEWAARVLIFANALAFSNRPLSAVSVRPFKPQAVPSALKGFPLHSGIGLTAAIAEVQARVLAELGSQWNGFGEDFVRACMYDCALEHDKARFTIKFEAYRQALAALPGGHAFIAAFQPPYNPHPPEDKRRGLHGTVLLVDRFIGRAVTAQDFFSVMRAVLTPVSLMTKADVKLVR